MTAEDIQKGLRGYFANYEYQLANTYVFDWESDFFCQSTSGYFVETEIKVSRSDYFKDFEKDKHKIFRDLTAGKSISVYTKNDNWNRNGDILVPKFQEIEIECRHYSSPAPWRLGENESRRIVNGSEELIEHSFDRKKFIVNDWADRLEITRPQYKRKDLRAPITRIGYHKLDEYSIPNQIYYAAPVGLIKPHELPPYAGLIEVGDYAGLVKKAPYMHKRKMDLDRILLKKFHNLWRYRNAFRDGRENDPGPGYRKHKIEEAYQEIIKTIEDMDKMVYALSAVDQNRWSAMVSSMAPHILSLKKFSEL